MADEYPPPKRRQEHWMSYFLERDIRSSAEFCGPGDYLPPAEE